MTDRPKHRIRLVILLAGCGVVLASLLAVSCLFAACAPPRDRVEVTFCNVPAKTVRVGVVVDENGAIGALPEYVHILFQYARRDPVWLWAWGGSLDPSPFPSDPREVAWREGMRHGVLTQDNDGAWRVTWFDPALAPLKDCSALFGGGKVEFDLAKGRSEPLSPEQLEILRPQSEAFRR
jgi:hypothetical protein